MERKPPPFSGHVSALSHHLMLENGSLKAEGLLLRQLWILMTTIQESRLFLSGTLWLINDSCWLTLITGFWSMLALKIYSHRKKMDIAQIMERCQRVIEFKN